MSDKQMLVLWNKLDGVEAHIPIIRPLSDDLLRQITELMKWMDAAKLYAMKDYDKKYPTSQSKQQ